MVITWFSYYYFRSSRRRVVLDWRDYLMGGGPTKRSKLAHLKLMEGQKAPAMVGTRRGDGWRGTTCAGRGSKNAGLDS